MEGKQPDVNKGSCAACKAPDTDEMVQCDHCDTWWHFGCVGVGDSISERSFTCPACQKATAIVSRTDSGNTKAETIIPTSAVARSTSASSRTGSRLVLQRLEAEKTLREKELQFERRDEARKREQERIQKDAEYERRQMQIEVEFLRQKIKALEVEDDAVSVARSRKSVHSGIKKVEEWRKGLPLLVAQSTMQEPRRPELIDFPGKLAHQAHNDISEISKVVRSRVPTQSVNTRLEHKNSHLIDFGQATNSVTNLSGLSREVWPNVSTILNDVGVDNRGEQHRFGCDVVAKRDHGPTTSPTQRQLISRQLMSSDLPVFYGNPEDWPVFITTFRTTSEACGYNETENLVRLQRALKGAAYEAVRSRLMMPEAVPLIIEQLDTLYGRPELLVQTLLQKVRQVPAPKADKLETLVTFGLEVQNLSYHLIAANQQAHLNNPTLLFELVDKLPTHLQLDWGLHMENIETVDLQSFSAYMGVLVRAASRVTRNLESLHPKISNKLGRGEKGKEKNFCGAHAEKDLDSEGEGPDGWEQAPQAVMAHTSNDISADGATMVDVPHAGRVFSPACFICQNLTHRVKSCPEFGRMSIADRWRKARDLNICRSCLSCHGRRPCKSAKQCGIGGCQKKHHPLLHENRDANVEPEATGAVNNHHHAEPSTLYRILPVTLHGNGRTVQVFAFMDEGSSLTLVEEEVIDQLQIKGEAVPLCLQWTANVERNERNSKRISLEISGQVNPGQLFKLKDVRTVSSLNLPKQTIQGAKLAQKYPHLQGLPIQSYENAIPKILIGNDNLHVGATQRIREGAIGEPVGAKCRLGWTVYGALEYGSRRASMFHICECEHDLELHELVEEYFRIDNLGIRATKKLESEDTKRAEQIMKRTTRRIEGRFETGLIFKYDYFELPDSMPMAERRLQCLERRMAKDSVISESVRRQMKEYVDKKYIHEATDDELRSADPRKTWYLPLGIAINPKKPSKIRIFCDAAAKVGGISLNTVLMKGPDLLSSLPRILFGFRERPVAICADIKEMFHQVKIRKEDRDCQRLLWRENVKERPKIYIMDVATFGSTCSPCSAQYVMNLNASEHEQDFPDAAEAIKKRHYMDDWMDSVDGVEQAVKLALEVRTIHSNGGFQLHNWLSNSPEFLKRVGASNGCAEKPLNLDCSSTERVLGMFWIPKSDIFTYQSAMRMEQTRPTKREVLRAVMSLFDPLGLLSFFVVHGKIIIQDIWRAKTEWDEKIPHEISERWQSWAKYFETLNNIRIERCYFPNYTTDQLKEVQLHVFCDASDSAYACVAYIRAKVKGKVHCSLVAGKAKVAPLKVLSIPRLELQAAVIGARMQNTIVESHRLEIERSVFWTDSKTVLAWLNSDQRKYTKFVGVRVGEILSSSKAEDWRWIPSKLNVADDATKWGKNPNFSPDSRWFRGPDFLSEDESAWPANTNSTCETREEVQHCLVHIFDKVLKMVKWEDFSNWVRLWRAVGYVHRYCDNFRARFLRQKLKSGPLSQNELIRAEATIFRWIQKEAYPKEFKALAHALSSNIKSVKLESCSPLRKLSPCLDHEGIIRLESRIVAASYTSFDVRYPIILPSNHAATKLLLNWYHRRLLHGNHETVVNEVRQKYHISNLRSVLRKVVKGCSFCRVRGARPLVPRMAPLPEARLQAYIRPFSFTGLDYCGPFNIRIGRATVKRWIALFTCLTIRAIHLEVVHSLSTESCKMAIRRFIVHHGSPREIYSDNGTNFVGVRNELSREIKAEELSECFTNANTKWIFNPPLAPHMGGAWERLVRSVKAAMCAMQMTKNPDEETFATIVREAEDIVNSRPLTFIPIENGQQEALTPNHFLKLSSDGVTQTPKRLKDDRSAHRNNWNHLNNAVDQFWYRWVREYLPTITRRTKWFHDTKEIVPGDLVIIVNESERNGWTRGRVVSLSTAADGRKRRAVVQTSSGLLRRAVAKLARLEVGGKTGSD
ncbi:uncharacterized protein LOC129745574 [Uranotaenia lowii]|uniref:uncharacterized protein LOC129745574 n=2 Tax=Uranotaenia lowii TaxID=190385 RepID=UPI002478B68A|nr:uncharacterized protein LOC129745574 [Uranotaenia lowii]XP_055594695.1 uncharacterized protein LOC129745574 [Uranotaenia lowii]